MNRLHLAAHVLTCTSMLGCAHIDFGADGLLYYEPVPYLFVSRAADCTSTATLMMLPGQKKHLTFVDGYGSANLSVTFSNGMITAVGQAVDNKLPEALTALAALRPAAAPAVLASAPGQVKCPSAHLHLIRDGRLVPNPASLDVLVN